MGLNQLIAECSDYDFKEQLEIKKPKSWLKSVSAFANGIGGLLFFGVDNDRNLVNIENPQFVCDKISELINSKIDPIPSYIIEPCKEKQNGVEFVYIVLKVESGPTTPYYYSVDGNREAYVRSGNQSVKAPRYILEELILKGRNKTYDSLITNYLKSDYSFTFFEATFLENTHTKISKSDYVSFSLATSDGFLTNAGVLLADQNIYRHNRVFCTRWNGLNKTSLEEASDDAEFTGGVVKLLDSTLNFIKNNTKKKWKKTARCRVEMPEYEETSIRETLVNALIHRQYTNVGAEVTVDIYDNRIVITSPGSMASGIIINKEIKTEIPSIRRNPILADIFARMKFMDRRGSGFEKIINGTNRLFNDNNNHVDIFANDVCFTVVIYNANYDDSQNVTNDVTNDVTSDVTNDVTLNGILNDNEEIVYYLIKQKPNISILEVSKKINKTTRTVKRIIFNLKEKNIIKRSGTNKKGYWEIIE